MIYLPACMIALIYIIFQIGNRVVVNKYGASAVLISRWGEIYNLQPIMCIGGKKTEIDVQAGFRKKREIPELAEIRYENGEYRVRNLDEECCLYIKRDDRQLELKEEQEAVLKNADQVIITYEDIQVNYTFERR